MQLPDFDSRSESRPKEKPMSFQSLVDQLRPQMEKIPEEDKMPLLPPSPTMLEEVQDYVRSALLLPLADSLPPSIQVGYEFLDRSLIRVGRVGSFNKLPVFAFLYPFVPKRLDCVLVYPKDGVDIEMIGRIVFWGQTATLPLKYVRTEILPSKTYFELETFSLRDLADAPALKVLEDRAWRNATSKVIAAENLQKAAEAKVRVLTENLEAESSHLAESEVARDGASYKANFWKMGTILVAVVLTLFAVGVFMLWPRSIS